METLRVLILAVLLNIGPLTVLKLFSKNEDDISILVFFLWCMAAVFTSLTSALVAVLIGVIYGWLELVLYASGSVLFWLALVYYIRPFRNMVGDLMHRARCYGCGNTHLFSRDVTIPIDDGGGLLVCGRCGKNPSGMNHQVVVYGRLLQAGVDSAKTLEVEGAVETYKARHLSA